MVNNYGNNDENDFSSHKSYHVKLIHISHVNVGWVYGTGQQNKEKVETYWEQSL
jgi:hypothetical protein